MCRTAREPAGAGVAVGRAFRQDPYPAARSRVPAGHLLWSLVDDAEVVEGPDTGSAGLTVVGGGRRVDVVDPSPTVLDVLWRMGLGPVALQNVAGLQESFANWTSGRNSCGPWSEVKAVLDRLGGFVVMSLADVGSTGLVISVSAVDGVTDPPALGLPEVDPHERHRLLPAAQIDRPGPGRAALTDPEWGLRVHVYDAAAIALVDELVRGPRAAVELAHPDLALPAVLDVLAFLAGARLVAPIGLGH